MIEGHASSSSPPLTFPCVLCFGLNVLVGGFQVREADIVVCAAGRAEMVKADWIKPGAAVIDVGINSLDDPTTKKG